MEQTQPGGYEVVLTEKAARVIREAFDAEQVDPEKSYVRIGALPGGCSGYKFTIDFAESADVGDADAFFTSQDIQLVVAQDCLTEVLGSVEVDYRDGNLVDQGFSFTPLRDAAQCGCGQSFAPIKDSAKPSA